MAPPPNTLPFPCTPPPRPRAQVSFVNSIATMKGGTHVDYIVNQITK